MQEWWSSLSGLEHILYSIAVPSTLFLLIQTLMLLAGFSSGDSAALESDASGLDSGVSTDTDVSVSGADAHPGPGDFAILKFFTLQGCAAFFCLASWCAILFLREPGFSAPLALAIAMLCGFFGMYCTAKIIQLSTRLTQNGTLDMRNTLGRTGSVYLPIPPSGQGEGKVMLAVQGSMRELAALTHGEALATGTPIRVVALKGAALVVEKYTD